MIGSFWSGLDMWEECKKLILRRDWWMAVWALRALRKGRSSSGWIVPRVIWVENDQMLKMWKQELETAINKKKFLNCNFYEVCPLIGWAWRCMIEMGTEGGRFTTTIFELE